MKVITNTNKLCHFPFFTPFMHRAGPFNSERSSLDNSLPSTIQAVSLPALIPSNPFLPPTSPTPTPASATECRELRAVFSTDFCCFSRLDQPSPKPRATRAQHKMGMWVRNQIHRRGTLHLPVLPSVFLKYPTTKTTFFGQVEGD